MFEISIDKEASILNHNKSVADSSSKLESTLKNEYIPIAYHLVIWNVAASLVRMGWIEVITNIAD